MENDITPKTLEAARKRAGLSMQQLAEKSGVALTTIWRIEKGKRRLGPAFTTWQRILDGLRAAQDSEAK